MPEVTQDVPALFSLHGRVALVTGASEGLGAAIASGLAQAGAHVIVNSRDPNRASAVSLALTQAGLSADSLPFDVADTHAAREALASLHKHWGRLDIVVNNVGMRHRASVAEITPSDFAHMLDVNVTAAYSISRSAAEFMSARQHGRILMIASIAGIRAKAGDAAYITSKGALISLTLALANEFGPLGITCNAIAPGVFKTEANALIAQRDSPRVSRIPLRRAAELWEIAGPALFLCSDAASYINGHVLIVDGGSSTVL